MQTSLNVLEKYRKTQTGIGWHTAPDDGYLYDHLVKLLNEAGAIFEIKALFVDHNWLQVRAKQNGYAAYHKDLEIAWGISRSEALKQIEMNQEPVALAECFHYVLIQTTLARIAENQVAELVAQAVDTNFWTPTQALSLAALVPQDHRRAKMFTKILQTKKLDAQTRSNVSQIAVDITQAIESPGYRLQALKELAPHLDQPAQNKMLKLAVELALEQADDTIYADVHAFWLLSEHLDGDLLERAYLGALAIRNPDSQAWCLTRIAQQLDDTLRQNALGQAIVAAEKIPDELRRANALAQLAGHVTGRLAEQVLDLSLNIKDQRWHGRVFEDLVPNLNEEQLTRVLDARLEIPDFFYRWRVLESIGRVATGEIRARVIDALPNHQWEETVSPDNLSQQINYDLKSILSIQDDEDFERSLRDSVQYLPDSSLPKVLKRVEQVENQVSRDLVFRSLAKRLSGALLSQALKAPMTVEDKISFARTLGVLSDKSNPPTKRSIQNQILKIILSIRTPWQRIEPLVEFIPTSEGSTKAKAVKQALKDIKQLANQEFRARMMASIIAFLPENQRQEMITSVLNLVWSFETTSETLQRLNIQAYSGFVDKIEPKDLEIWERIRILSLVMDHLDEPQKTDTLRHALEMRSDIESHLWQSATMVELAHHLKGDLLEVALSESLAIPSERDRVDAINAFIPYLPISGLLRIFDISSQIEHTSRRVALLVNLAKHVDNEHRDQIQASVIDLVMQEKNMRTRIKYLADMAALGINEALIKGIDEAKGLTDEWDRAQALAMFVPFADLPHDTLKQIHLGLLSHLQSLRTEKRETLYQDLVDEDIFTPPILSTQILSACATSMVQIYQHWNWI